MAKLCSLLKTSILPASAAPTDQGSLHKAAQVSE
jgi:hypothetical protein